MGTGTYMWDKCVIYELTSINHVIRKVVYILCKLHFMLLVYITIKYGYHTANIGHTPLILYGQTDVTLWHTCAKTATSTSRVAAIYVPKTYMPTRLHIIYAIYLKAILRATNEVTGISRETRAFAHATMLTAIPKTTDDWQLHRPYPNQPNMQSK